MTRKFKLLTAALLLSAPLPVLAAADPACAVDRTTPAFRADVSAAMTSGDEAAREKLFPTLDAAVKACAEQAGYTEAQRDAYFDMVLSEISRGWLTAEMAKTGLKTALIDKALDFGPGRTNPPLDENISEAQIEAIVAAFIADGVAVDKITEKSWEQVGSYAAASAIYWQAIKQLP
ncbi:MAG: hypothetical protein HC788_11125 [Sphingopyxis sp.]|nr:hypothetical protein [Sphingopyxis sp.]